MADKPIAQYIKGDKLVEIYHDTTPESPREWDNLGIMVAFHKRYDLGDKHDLKSSDFSGLDELKKYLIKEKGAIAILPLYLYDHSGLTMGTKLVYPFNDRWDAMQVGYIYTTKEKLKEMGLSLNTPKKKLLTYLDSGVQVYDQYLRGDVYGYMSYKVKYDPEYEDILKKDEDSTWGIYGMDDIKDELGINKTWKLVEGEGEIISYLQKKHPKKKSKKKSHGTSIIKKHTRKLKSGRHTCIKRHRRRY